MSDEIWKEWIKDQTPENNKKILGAVDKRIEFAVSKFKTSGVPESVLRTKAKKLALHQMKSYNVESPANLATHVSYALRKMSDFVEDEKNIVRIPSNIRLQIPNFIKSRDELRDRLGRVPNLQELSDHMGIGYKLTSKLESSVNRNEMINSRSQLSTNTLYESDKESDAIKRVYYDIFDPEEKLVFEYTFGVHGKTRLTPKNIARESGLHEQKVRRLQQKIAKRVKD